MQIEIMAAMKQAITSVFDTMFFLPVQIGANRAPADCFAAERPVGALLSFEGPASGTAYLQIPNGLAAELTADFLGVRPGEISESDMRDTVMEALNMIVGNTLSRLAEADAFRLGLPESIPAAEPFAPAAPSQQPLIPIETEKGLMAAGIRFDLTRNSV